MKDWKECPFCEGTGERLHRQNIGIPCMWQPEKKATGALPIHTPANRAMIRTTAMVVLENLCKVLERSSNVTDDSEDAASIISQRHSFFVGGEEVTVTVELKATMP